jgi:hypothetical protein
MAGAGLEVSLATGVGLTVGLGLAPVKASQLVSKNNVVKKISFLINSPDLNTTQVRLNLNYYLYKS